MDLSTCLFYINLLERELLPIQVDWKISYEEKTRSSWLLRTNWRRSNQGGELGVRNVLHYRWIIYSEPKKMKLKYQIVRENTTDPLILKELKKK